MKVSLIIAGIAFAAIAGAQQQKVGIIHIQNAIVGTRDGQKAATELQSKFAPRKAELERKQGEVAALQDQMRKGSNTMSEEARNKLSREIDTKTTALNRATQDAQTDLDEEQGKIMQELGQRIMAVIDKYARDNGYTLILDISSPQTPVLYAANGIEITTDIVKLYDQNAPSAAAPAAPAPAAAAPAAAKPPAAPVKRAPGAVK